MQTGVFGVMRKLSSFTQGQMEDTRWAMLTAPSAGSGRNRWSGVTLSRDVSVTCLFFRQLTNSFIIKSNQVNDSIHCTSTHFTVKKKTKPLEGTKKQKNKQYWLHISAGLNPASTVNIFLIIHIISASHNLVITLT